jgi:hypothetical protein
VISPTQRPLPDNTQHPQETDSHAPGRIRTRNPSKLAAAHASDRAATGIGYDRSITDTTLVICGKVNTILIIAVVIQKNTFCDKMILLSLGRRVVEEDEEEEEDEKKKEKEDEEHSGSISDHCKKLSCCALTFFGRLF